MSAASQKIKLAYSAGESRMDNEEVPAPLVPSDCDLSHLKMMVDPDKILSSKTLAIMPETCHMAHIRLWFQGWKNVPCGSMPDDDFEIALAAGFSSREMSLFEERREWIMKNWVKCSDGRWYHKTIAAEALELWVERIVGRVRSAKANAARNHTKFNPDPLHKILSEAVNLLEAIRPTAKRIVTGFPESFLQGFDPSNPYSPKGSSEEPARTPKDKVREDKRSKDNPPNPPEGDASDPDNKKRKAELSKLVDEQFDRVWESMGFKKTKKDLSKRAFLKHCKGKTAKGIAEFTQMVIDDIASKFAHVEGYESPIRKTQLSTYLNQRRWTDEDMPDVFDPLTGKQSEKPEQQPAPQPEYFTAPAPASPEVTDGFRSELDGLLKNWGKG